MLRQIKTIEKLLELDKENLSTVSNWYISHGCIFQEDGKMVALCDMPDVLSKSLGAVSEPEKTFTNARHILYAHRALKRNIEIIEQLLDEIRK